MNTEVNIFQELSFLAKNAFDIHQSDAQRSSAISHEITSEWDFRQGDLRVHSQRYQNRVMQNSKVCHHYSVFYASHFL